MTAADASRSRHRGAIGGLLLVGVLAIAVFALHYDVLTVPPAIEQARGLWLQASYLADTHFDYRRMEAEEPGPDQSSAYAYQRRTTSLPALLAVMMLVLPSPLTVIVAYRLLTFLAAALIAAMVYDVVRPYVGRAIGLLLIAALLTTPVFFVQTELLDMEIPLALASVAVAWFLARGRVGWSVLPAALAVPIKISGVIAPAALVAGLTMSAICSRGWKVRLAAWSLVLVAAAVFYAALARPGDSRILWHDLRRVILVTAPDLVVLAGIALLLVALALVREVQLPENSGQHNRVNQRRMLLYCWSFIVLLVVASDQMALMVRYLTAGIPLLFIVLAASRFRPAIAVIALALLAWNTANRDGRFLPDLDERFAPGGSGLPFLLERSREYLPDHQLRMRFVETAAKHSQGRPIVTEYPYGYLLSVPRLGWVNEPSHGFSTYHGSQFYTNFREFDFRSAPDGSIPSDCWFAFVEHPIGFKYGGLRITRELPPAESGDEIVLDQASGQRYLVFSKRWQVDGPTSEAALRPWIAAGASFWDFDEPTLEDALRFRLEVLRVLGLYQQALSEFDALLADSKANPAIRSVFLSALAYRFPPQQAWPRCQRYAELFPEDAFGWAMCGYVALRGGDLPVAEQTFERALETDPNHVEALSGAGVVHVHMGQFAEAEAYFKRGLAAQPPPKQTAELWHWLGEIRLAQNRPQEAAECFERALAFNSELLKARQRLADLSSTRQPCE